MKYLIIILLVAFIGSAFIFKDNIKSIFKETKISKVNKDKKDQKGDSSSDVQVSNKWPMPERLKEISGISYLDQDRFACVQDELGTMFIYNINHQKIEKEIPFGKPGDYEDITLAGNDAYIVRSDGLIFEIANWNGNPAIKEYRTSLTPKHNVEGLAYDKSGNRLLLAIKDREPATKEYKGVYSFDLGSKLFNETPAYKIPMNGSNTGKKGKKNKGFNPSAIGLHPTSNDLYVVDGPDAILMIMGDNGAVKKVLSLGKSFQQPEGISFSPAGDMFISNEGANGPGNIMQVVVQ